MLAQLATPVKICYFDAFSGISGDMALAALLDCGIRLPRLKEALAGLKVSNYSIRRSRVRHHGISATRLEVRVKGTEKRRSLGEILKILEKSDIDADIQAKASAIFRRMARAEPRGHGERIRDVHFHEIGSTDAIVDIVGVLIALKMLGVGDVYSTPLPLGAGFVDPAHGLMPLPSPATVEILRGYPVRKTGREKELTTPTGASLMARLSRGVDLPSPFIVERVGYGAGQRESDLHPNLLRALLGEARDTGGREPVNVIETVIDDMDPQLIPYFQDEIVRSGAIEVYR